MKKIAIIGAGICGLRAMLEFKSKSFSVTVFEKAKSVGGRVATRRFQEKFVNHGIENLSQFSRLNLDPVYQQYKHQFTSGNRATDLPKAMAAANSDHSILFEKRISDINELDGYDAIIMTQPIPQVIEILGPMNSLDAISYSKKILFIGLHHGETVRLELSDESSSELFDLPEATIRQKASLILDTDLSQLDLKKWRYSRVVNGMPVSFLEINPRCFIAGDAFDPIGDFDLSSAWISGREVARHIISKFS